MFTKSLRCRQFPALSIDPCEVLREAGASIGAKPRVAASPGSGVRGRGARGRRLPWVRSSPEPSPCSEACGGNFWCNALGEAEGQCSELGTEPSAGPVGPGSPWGPTRIKETVPGWGGWLG